MERLLAFGRSRLEVDLQHADLIRNAGFSGANRSFAAYSFAATHVRYLLGELEVRGDIALLAVALLAPLELPILDQQLRIEQIDVERIYAGWADLAHPHHWTWWRRSPKVSPSTSAPHDASMTLCPTPTVTHDDAPSLVSMSTRVIASVPWPWSRIRTL